MAFDMTDEEMVLEIGKEFARLRLQNVALGEVLDGLKTADGKSLQWAGLLSEVLKRQSFARSVQERADVLHYEIGIQDEHSSLVHRLYQHILQY